MLWWVFSEGLAKGFLRLVLLVLVSEIKRVRALANDIRPHVNVLAFHLPSPVLCGLKEKPSDIPAAHLLIDYQTVHFGPPFHFEQGSDSDVNPANDFSRSAFRNKANSALVTEDRNQPLPHLGFCGGIPELAG